jgi:hypothetical protein
MAGAGGRVKYPFCKGEGEMEIEDYVNWVMGLARLIRKRDP